jgi:hypothetical protein
MNKINKKKSTNKTMETTNEQEGKKTNLGDGDS